MISVDRRPIYLKPHQVKQLQIDLYHGESDFQAVTRSHGEEVARRVQTCISRIFENSTTPVVLSIHESTICGHGDCKEANPDCWLAENLQEEKRHVRHWGKRLQKRYPAHEIFNIPIGKNK